MKGEILTFLLKGMKRATQSRNAAASQRKNIQKKLSLESAECSSSFNIEFQFGSNIMLRGNMIGFKCTFFPLILIF